MSRSACLFLVASSLLAASAPSHASSALALAQKEGCLGCHAVATKIVGPAYQDVAAKYRGQPDAVATLVQHIREGGSGRWGDIPMPPQKQLSAAQAKQLATWVLGGAK
ncbi:MAG: c-type cytochrome [Burkholderiales bacterium]|nr:c-type cytochrome [Burkholderiales bacterium]MDE2275024.1 c-type cytochrome [Burkholderiales bacterium]